MGNELTVVVTNISRDVTVENVTHIEHEDELVLRGSFGEKRFGSDWRVKSVDPLGVSVESGDWIKYLYNDVVYEGEIKSIEETELTVKQAPNGFIIHIPHSSVIKKV